MSSILWAWRLGCMGRKQPSSKREAVSPEHRWLELQTAISRTREVQASNTRERKLSPGRAEMQLRRDPKPSPTLSDVVIFQNLHTPRTKAQLQLGIKGKYKKNHRWQKSQMGRQEAKEKARSSEP